jgi:hypothetical protein
METTMHQTRVASFLTKFTTRAATAVAASALAVTLLPLVPSLAAGATLFEQVGTLERFGADARAALGDQLVPTHAQATDTQKRKAGTIIAIPKARQLWQLYTMTFPTITTGIVVRDLDTLEIKRTMRLTSEVKRATLDPFEGGDWAHVVDDAGTRLWLLDSGGKFFYEVNLKTFSVARRLTPSSASPGSFPFNIGGMTYDPFHDDLLLLYGGPAATSAGNTNVFVYRLDVSGAPPATFDQNDLTKRLYRLRSCTAPITSIDSGGDTSGWEILVTKDFLYVPCQRAGHTVIVVRTPRSDDGTDTGHPEDVAAGPVYGNSVLADPGSGRLFVYTNAREIWAFETSTMSFVGVVATSPDGETRRVGWGLDRATGRIFFQSAAFGLGVGEGRFFPIPQARTHPEFKTGQERIWSDAATNRVFVLQGDGIGNNPSSSPVWHVYKTGPAPEPPPAPDPDRNTLDVPEQEGVTEARFNASASGYGTRILLAKGYAGMMLNPSLGAQTPLEGVPNGTRERCGFTDRDIYFGRVAKAEYDTGSTAAQAGAVAVDGATAQDLNQPSRCRELGVLGDGERWAYKSASCATSEGSDPQRSEGANESDLGNDFGPATVDCPKPGGALTAKAESRSTGLLDVNRAWTETTVTRLPDGGLRSTVTSVAQGISLGLGLHIGEVRSTAVSTSNGRPRREAMSQHEIAVSHVRLGEQVLCEVGCDLPRLERQLNDLANGRVVFRTGKGANSGRDEDLVLGSRRGAQTAVQKSVARQASDRALVGDFTVEVPALEMTVFNDNTSWGRARQIYQFAGVASSATYNIVKRPAFAPFDDPGSASEDVDVANAGNTPFTELVQGTTDGGFGGGDVALPLTPTARGRAGGDDGPGGLAGVVQAIAKGLRVFFSDPRQALLLLTAWVLLGSPAVLSRRRRLLGDVRTR